MDIHVPSTNPAYGRQKTAPFHQPYSLMHNHTAHNHATHGHGSHDHGVQNHGTGSHSLGGRLAIVFFITAGFMVVEAVGGVISGSLALVADAGHMLTDTLAIALSWGAIWLAQRETTPQRTYGFKRAEILAAFVNALGLALLALWIIREAIARVLNPHPVMDGVLLGVATAGLMVNVIGLMLLRHQAQKNITVRAATWHILGDLLGSIGAITAGLVIRFTGWTGIDPIIGIGIALLIAIGSGRMLLDTTNLLLDSVPRDIDSVSLRAFLNNQPEVVEICDLHIWAVSASDTMLTAHLVVHPDVERDAFQHRLLAELRDQFSLTHMTLQLEGSPLETCDNNW